MTKNDTIVFIPTYNERENVEEMVRQLKELNLPFDILFVDDNSTDGTKEILNEMVNRHQNIKVIHRPAKLGIGSAHLTGIHYAFNNGYRILITMDCDFTHSPKDIPIFLKTAGTVDIVVGTRFMCDDSLKEWNMYRKTLTKLGHFLTRTLLKIPYDATGAFRAYNLKKIQKEVFYNIVSPGYAFFFESLFLLNRMGYKIVEIPINLPARTYGHSKMNYKEICRSLLQLFKLSFKRF